MFKSIRYNMKKYSFLLYELISRDFKVKYKRSALGVVWSLLYPVLTMIVMYMVFSRMFRFSMPGVNYMVYLLTGLVFYNYFNEASNLAMSSVIANFGLINKVYVPKYIFPLSKCLFVGINFLMSLIPLYIVILFTGTEETRCVISALHLLLPYAYICLFMFTLGMGFILSTVSIFLRDIIYLYSVLLMMWMYLTPIMYDISMITSTLQAIMKFNPLYQYINFARMIILYNEMPKIGNFLGCAVSSVLILLIGVLVFRKNQDKFIYYV